MRNEKVYKLTLTALMAALSYVVFTFLQIKIARYFPASWKCSLCIRCITAWRRIRRAWRCNRNDDR